MRVSVVVAGGHSAGHIEPALAVADAIRRIDPSATITALGTVRGLDTTLIPARGYHLELIPPVPLPRKLNAALLRVPIRLWESVRATRAILARADADVVVGFGGYVALPAYLAARRAKIPIVVHEANARPGLANRLGARLTGNVYTASVGIELPHARVVGIPLRPAIADLDRAALRDEARAEFGFDRSATVVLVTGGSQGAQSINRVIEASRPMLRAAGISVLHVVGPANDVASDEPDQSSAATAGRAPARYVAVPFVEQMQRAYATADFVICRSGAMTCAELSAVGLPAVYVPLPLRGGEQRLNAEPIVRAGGALLVENERFSAEWIAENLLPCLLDPERVAAMSAAAARAGARDADLVLARRVLELARTHHGQD